MAISPATINTELGAIGTRINAPEIGIKGDSQKDQLNINVTGLQAEIAAAMSGGGTVPPADVAKFAKALADIRANEQEAFAMQDAVEYTDLTGLSMQEIEDDIEFRVKGKNRLTHDDKGAPIPGAPPYVQRIGIDSSGANKRNLSPEQAEKVKAKVKAAREAKVKSVAEDFRSGKISRVQATALMGNPDMVAALDRELKAEEQAEKVFNAVATLEAQKLDASGNIVDGQLLINMRKMEGFTRLPPDLKNEVETIIKSRYGIRSQEINARMDERQRNINVLEQRKQEFEMFKAVWKRRLVMARWLVKFATPALAMGLVGFPLGAPWLAAAAGGIGGLAWAGVDAFNSQGKLNDYLIASEKAGLKIDELTKQYDEITPSRAAANIALIEQVANLAAEIQAGNVRNVSEPERQRILAEFKRAAGQNIDAYIKFAAPKAA